MSLAIRPIALSLGCLGLRLLPTIRCQGVAAGGCSALLSRPGCGIYVRLYITQASTANACTINNPTYSVSYGKRLIP